jgi:flagellar motor switch protein FliM
VINLVTTDLTEAWKPTIDVSFNAVSTETNPEVLQAGFPNEALLVFAVEIKLGDTRGTLRIGLPFSTLEPILDTFDKGSAVETKEEDTNDRPKVLRRVLRAPVAVTCELSPTMVAVSDLLNLAGGDIIVLDSKLGDSVQLLVEGKPSYSVSLMDMDGHKSAGVIDRITD